MANKDETRTLKCSFCGKPQNKVRKLIAGPGVYICDECIGICSSILEEELGMHTAHGRSAAGSARNTSDAKAAQSRAG